MAGLQGRPEDHKADDPQIWIDYRNTVGGVLVRRGEHPWNLVTNVLQQDTVSRRRVTTPEGHIEEGDDVDLRSRRMQDDAWETRRALAESVAASHTMDFTGRPMGRLELTRHDREMEQPQDVPITKADDFGRLLARRDLIRKVSGDITYITNEITVEDPYVHPWRPPPAGKHTTGLFTLAVAAASAFQDDTYYAVPVLIPKQSSYTGISLYVNNAASVPNGKVIVGLYADDTPNCRPGVLVAQSTEWTVPDPSNADKLFSFTGGVVALVPNWYWLVMIATGIEGTAIGLLTGAVTVATIVVESSYVEDSSVGAGNYLPAVLGFMNTAEGYPASPPALMDPFTAHIAVDVVNQTWAVSGRPPRLVLTGA